MFLQKHFSAKNAASSSSILIWDRASVGVHRPPVFLSPHTAPQPNFEASAEFYQQSFYAPSDSSDSNNQNDMWNEFDTVWQQHRANVKIGHVNANSIAGFKFQEIKTWLLDGRFDILVISETKIDSTFPDSHFHVSRFRMCRAYRTRGAGGLMAYFRSDCCVKIVTDLPNLAFSERARYKTESIVFKVMIGKTWETCWYLSTSYIHQSSQDRVNA